MRHPQRVVRNLAMWALFVAILIFYLPLVAAIQVGLGRGGERRRMM